MTVLFRRFVALFLCMTIGLPVNAGAAAAQQRWGSRSEQQLPLREYLQKSYLELFELAPALEFSQSELDRQRDALKKGKDICVDRFENHMKQYGKQVDATRKDLKKNTGTLTEVRRKESHCNIQNLELLRSEAE